MFREVVKFDLYRWSNSFIKSITNLVNFLNCTPLTPNWAGKRLTSDWDVLHVQVSTCVRPDGSTKGALATPSLKLVPTVDLGRWASSTMDTGWTKVRNGTCTATTQTVSTCSVFQVMCVELQYDFNQTLCVTDTNRVPCTFLQKNQTFCTDFEFSAPLWFPKAAHCVARCHQ